MVEDSAKDSIMRVALINERLCIAPSNWRGPVYSRNQIAELLKVPRERITSWIKKNRRLYSWQIQILHNGKRPAGYIQKSGNIRLSTREIIYNEIDAIAKESMKKELPLDLDEAFKKSKENHPEWDSAYMEASLYYIEEHPKARAKPPRVWKTKTKNKQRRAALARKAA